MMSVSVIQTGDVASLTITGYLDAECHRGSYRNANDHGIRYGILQIRRAKLTAL